MSYSDATPDSPVPNPPLIQSITADAPTIAQILAPYFAPASTQNGTQWALPGRAHRGVATTPPGVTVSQLGLDTIDYDPTFRFITFGPQSHLAYQVFEDGYYHVVAEVFIALSGSIQGAFALDLVQDTGSGPTEISVGEETPSYIGSNGADFSQTGSLGLVLVDTLFLRAGSVIYVRVFAPYQFAYGGSGQSSVNFMAVHRVA